MASRVGLAAVLALVLLSVVWSWWAIAEGAYFGVVLYPGALILAGGLLVLANAAPWQGSLRKSRPTAVALGSLIALGLWSGLSALWSPSPDTAIADAQRVLAYAIAFGLGIWLCNLLGERMQLAMLPLAVAGLVAGVYTAVTLLTGDDPRDYLEIDGTLDYPFGYRNANAAFFAIALWPALGLAAARQFDWRLRAVAFGGAVLCLELVLASQSRGSIVAGFVALCVYVLLAPDRARSLGWLALATGVSLAVLPASIELFREVNDNGNRAALDELHSLGRWALAGAAIALPVGAVAAWVDDRVSASRARIDRLNRLATAAVVGTIVAGIGFAFAAGDPLEFVGQRVEEFKTQGTPDRGEANTRFTVNAGSERGDLWRVALERAGANPLLGEGGGGYQYAYDRERTDITQSVHDAHSVELETLSELGVPGLLMLLGAIAGATLAALRARRLGPSAAALSATALTTGAYWLTHTSIDWFWAYPGLTAPVIALVGAACAPTLRTAEPAGGRSGRRWLIAGLIVFAVTVVPPFLSERYTNSAFGTWRSDLERAYADLDAAATLNPFAEEPLLAEGAIARANGDRDRAVDALREAAERHPEEWVMHYLLARVYLRSDPDLALRELRIADELNPLVEQVDSTLELLRRE
jgi:hypothetical protein